MPTPSVSANVATTHNWVSAMDTTQNVLKPEVSAELTKRYGNQNMTGLIESMSGGMNPVAAIYYDHFEEDWLHSIVKVDASVYGVAANVTQTIVVVAAYQYSYPATAQTPYIVTGAQNTVPLLNNQEVQFPNGVQARVTNINYTTGAFDVTPKVSGQSIPAVTTATELIIIGNSHGEQTGQPGSRNSRLFRYRNNLQIQKWDNTTSGTAMGEKIWVEVEGLNGQKGYLWYFKAQLDEFKRAKNEREWTAITGVKTTNTTLASIAGQEQNVSTEGLIPFIENYGNIAPYSSVPGITLADFQLMIRTQLNKFRGAEENSLWVGINLRQGIEAFMRDTMKNGSILYGSFGGDKSKYINFGFDSFTESGYTFHMKTYDPFNTPMMGGAAGQPYPDMGLVCPMGNTVTSMGPNKEKTSVPSMRINYLSQKGAGGSYSRDWEEWFTGAANGVFTETTDQVAYHMRSHWGFEAFAPQRFVKIYKV